MRLTYCDEDDTLVIHISDKPVAKEVMQDWNTHVSYTEDGLVAEITVVDARISGVVPARYLQDTDTLYIEFQKSEVTETRDLDEDTLLDVDVTGQIVAMTIEHARERAVIPLFSFAQIAA